LKGLVNELYPGLALQMKGCRQTKQQQACVQEMHRKVYCI